MKENTLSLQDLTEKYSHVRMASLSDNREILEFLAQQEMKAGPIELDFDRGSDFFAYCRLHSENFFVFLFLNDDSSIGGIGTLLRKFRRINGATFPVGYLCDLRVSPKASRKTHLQWRKFYADLVEYLPQGGANENCHELFTAIFDDNEAALKSLTSRLKEVSYLPAGHYESHILFLKKPRRKGSKHYDISLDHSLKALETFLQKETEDLRWAPIFADTPCNELHHRRTHWKGWNDIPWITLTNERQEIIACAKAWVDPGYRRLRVRSAPRSLVRMTRALSLLGRPQPQLNQPLNVLSIPFLIIDRNLSQADQILAGEELLAAIWCQAWRRECHFVQWSPPPQQLALATAITNGYWGTRKGGYLFKVTSARASNQLNPSEYGSRSYFETSL